MAEIRYTVDATGGKDYTSIQAAIDDINSADDYVLECYSGGDLGAGNLSLTLATGFRIEVPAAEQHDGVSGGAFTGALLSGNGGASLAFYEVFGLRIDNVIQSLPTIIAPIVHYERILATGPIRPTFAVLSNSTFDITVENCLLGGFVLTGTLAGGNPKIRARNSVFCRDNTLQGAVRFFGGAASTSGEFLVENCYARNEEGPAFDYTAGGGITITTNNNFSADDTADDFPGTGHVINVDTAASFEDYDNDDYRHKPGGDLVDAGKTLPEVTDDVNGIARPQGSAYDGGLFELEQAAFNPAWAETAGGDWPNAT